MERRERERRERKFRWKSERGLRVGLIFSWLIEGDEHTPRRGDDLGPLLCPLKRRKPRRETAVAAPLRSPYLRPTLDRRFQAGPKSHGGGKPSNRRRLLGRRRRTLASPFPPDGNANTFLRYHPTNFSFMIAVLERRAPFRSLRPLVNLPPLSVTVKRHLRRNLWKDVICRGRGGERDGPNSGENRNL